MTSAAKGKQKLVVANTSSESDPASSEEIEEEIRDFQESEEEVEELPLPTMIPKQRRRAPATGLDLIRKAGFIAGHIGTLEESMEELRRTLEDGSYERRVLQE